MKSRKREVIIIFLVLGTIIPGSWMMGGYYSLAPFWMGVGGWLSGLFSIVVLSSDKKLRKQNPALRIVWLFWIVLIIYLGVSLLNPSFERVQWAIGGSFIASNYIDWLPAVVSTSVSAPMVLQFTGSIILAWSVLAIVESRRKVRQLIFVLVINAAVLSLVGAWFKVVGSGSLLGVFKAVNDKFFASFTYHNHWVAFAGFHLMVGTGLACYYAFHPQRKLRSHRDLNIIVLLCVSAFFLFLSLFLVESRTGLLVGVGYLGVMGLYFLRRRLVLKNKSTRSVSILSLVGIFVLAIVSYQIVYPQLSQTNDRISKAWYQFWDEESEVDNFRFETGPKITAELIEEKTAFGWGWGSYPLAMSIYAPQYLENTYAQHAHNDWLQYVAELGVIGLLLYVFPLVHMSIHFSPQDNLTRFCRLGIGMLMVIAFIDGPFTNPIVLASVLVVFFSDLGIRSQSQ